MRQFLSRRSHMNNMHFCCPGKQTSLDADVFASALRNVFKFEILACSILERFRSPPIRESL